MNYPVRRIALSILLSLLLLTSSALAQLHGEYTIASAPAPNNFAGISEAIVALNSQGVDAAVVFKIAGGTYASPSTGFNLGSVNGMSATNTVTFKPAEGANVEIIGNGEAVFQIRNGRHFVIDGATIEGSPDKSMLLRNTSRNAIRMRNAQNITVRNCVLQANMQSSAEFTNAVLLTEQQTCSNIRIERNQIGDYEGVYRAPMGISALSVNNSVFADNDIINLFASLPFPSVFGIFASGNGNTVQRNKVHFTVPALVQADFTGISASGSEVLIDGNWVYDILGPQRWVEGIAASNMCGTRSITNNMISLSHQAQGFISQNSSGIYFGIHIGGCPCDGGSVVNISNNSVRLVTTSPLPQFVYMMPLEYYANCCTDEYPSNVSAGQVTVNHFNNIYSVCHQGAHVSLRVGKHVCRNVSESAVVVLNSSNNLLYGTFDSPDPDATGDFFTTSEVVGSNSPTGDPLFVSQSDLHVGGVNSPASNAGTPLPYVTRDFDNSPRSSSSPWIGAHEGFLPLGITPVEDVSLIAPADKFVLAPPGACGVNIPDLGQPSVTGNVGVPTNNAPAFFPCGKTTVVWRARGHCGVAKAEQKIFVEVSNAAPTISALPPITISECEMCSSVQLPTPPVSGGCPPLLIVHDPLPCPIPAGYRVIWHVVDACNQRTTATQPVNVTPAAPIVVLPRTGVSISACRNDFPNSSCDATVIPLALPQVTGGCAPYTYCLEFPTNWQSQSSVQVTWKVRDRRNLTDVTTTQTITVDPCIPSLTATIAPAHWSACDLPRLQSGMCEPPQSLPIPKPTASGGLPPYTYCLQSIPSGMVQGPFHYSVTWRVEDSRGESIPLQQDVTLDSCCAIDVPKLVELPNDRGRCFATHALTASLLGCGNIGITNDAPSTFPVGQTIVTWTTSDGQTRNTVVNVQDQESPSLSIRPITNRNFRLISGNTYSLRPRDNAMRELRIRVAASDNCPGVVWRLSSITSVEGPFTSSATCSSCSNPPASCDICSSSLGVLMPSAQTITVKLRAEANNFMGRTYSLTFKATDHAGNQVTQTINVRVQGIQLNPNP